MKRIAGVSERLLECAEEEFLEKGYQNASIRAIAQKAQTSPRAVYTRFPGKEGLFDAIVSPVSEGLVDLHRDYENQFWSKQSAARDWTASSFGDVSFYVDMVDYIYDHRNAFLLMQNSLDGTRLAALIRRLTETDLSHLTEHVNPEASGARPAKTGAFQIPHPQAAARMMQMLANSFYAALFEPLRGGMNRREARYYVEKLCQFFVAGIRRLLED